MKFKSAFVNILMIFIQPTKQISPEELHWVLKNSEILNNFDAHPLNFYCDNYRKMQVDQINYYCYDSTSDDYTCEIWMADFDYFLDDDLDIYLVDANKSYQFKFINSDYQIIYRNDNPESFDKADDNIRLGCICVVLKFRIMRHLKQKNFHVVVKLLKSKTYTQFIITWKKKYRGFRFSKPEEICFDQIHLAHLKMDSKCILFAKKKLLKVPEYRPPFLIKHKETGQFIEFTLDNLKYQEGYECNLEDMLSSSKRNELKVKKQTMRSIFENTVSEHA